MWLLRSPLEKLLVLTIIIHVAEPIPQDAKVEPHSTINTTQIANNILEGMDTTVDPCEDFYSYSCNGWVKSNPIPVGKSTWNTFLKVQQQNLLVMKHGLEKPVESFKSKAEMKAKFYYESCLDTNTLEALGATPVRNLLRKLGGWNITESGFNVDTWNLQKITQIVQTNFNINGLFAYGVAEDLKNSSRNILQVDQRTLVLQTRENYLSKTPEYTKVLKAYLKYMTEVGKLLGGGDSTEAQMQAVIDFETKLANITIPSELRADQEALYNRMTVSKLQELAPFLNWREFFQDAFRLVERKITDEEQLVVRAPEYLANLTSLIAEYNSTVEGKIVLNNYLVWQVVHSSIKYLSKAFRDANNGFEAALYGSAGGEESRWTYCIEDTNEKLGFAVGATFIREAFHHDSKLQAEEMINNIRNAFKKNFVNLNWMDADTRKLAVDKADAIINMIGYPEFMGDPQLLDERFSSLTVRNDTYIDNNFHINYFNLKENLGSLDKSVNRTSWSMAPTIFNAYYTATKNQIIFPAATLQVPLYDSSFPASLNYGGIGSVMGHELTHGFDNEGRQFDKYGNLNQWWNNGTIGAFNERTKCIAEQYSKYKINGTSVKGQQTLGENISDNGGLKAAYYAFLDVIKGKPEPQPLPGISINHRQLFFVAFAQVWCTAATKEAVTLQIDTDNHSPPEYRVIGPLANLREFSDVFHCKSGSKMNPVEKCEVW